jgi:predicted RNA binding protein with dsRBD fold (UPF0201 family)
MYEIALELQKMCGKECDISIIDTQRQLIKAAKTAEKIDNKIQKQNKLRKQQISALPEPDIISREIIYKLADAVFIKANKKQITDEKREQKKQNEQLHQLRHLLREKVIHCFVRAYENPSDENLM